MLAGCVKMTFVVSFSIKIPKDETPKYISKYIRF